ncbi:hypothetical protein V1512DRAFT_255692 [Lipomyces arxii]|uniref:uncharacterized protein n=1 Tax=Lipomyces arxii TaxID=56418 RepID=UPI0034CD0919
MDGNDSSENQSADPSASPPLSATAGSNADPTIVSDSSISNDNSTHESDEASLSTGPATIISESLSLNQIKSSSPVTTAAKVVSTAKKSFKPQSLNGMFRQLQATTVTSKASSEKANAATSQQSAQLMTHAAKLRKTPKLSTASGAFTLAPLRRDMSTSPRPGSAGANAGSGSSSRSLSQHVWNTKQEKAATTTIKNQKEFTEEELKKLGIHLTQSIADGSRETKWDDDDDDDDWGDTIEFGDGTKMVLTHTLHKEEQSGANVDSHSNDTVKDGHSDHGGHTTIGRTDPAEDSINAASNPAIHSPWAPIPHVQSTPLSKIVDGSLQQGDQFNRGKISDRREFAPDSSQHYSSQDARSRPPIVLPRDRFSDLEFDRSYGYRPQGHGPELFNDRSGLIEPVRRKSFSSRRPQMPTQSAHSPQKVVGVISRTGRWEDRPEDDTSRPRRGSSSISSGGRRRLSITHNADIGALEVLPDGRDQDSSLSPRLQHSQPQQEAEPSRPPHITARQDLIMKQSIENARRRKEEEQKQEQERLEGARKRAEEAALRAEQHENEKRKHSASDHNDGNAVTAFPEVEHVVAVKQLASNSSRRRKESAASSDGGDGIDASVTAAIEFLISETSAAQSPPVARATAAKSATPHSSPVGVSGWDEPRGTLGRSNHWNRNGLNESARAPYVRSLVNGNDNVWGPVGGVSRYPSIDGAEQSPFINAPAGGSHDATSTDWSAKSNTPAQLSENWRRPLATSSAASISQVAAKSGTGSAGSTAAMHAPVGTPLSSPSKGPVSGNHTSPPSAMSGDVVVPPVSISSAAPSMSSASSSRLLSKFFPSTVSSGLLGSIHRQSGNVAGMLPDLGEGIEKSIYMTDNDGRSAMDDYLLLSQSVQSLADDNGSIKPKVHLPSTAPTASLPHPERSNGISYTSEYSPEIASDGPFSLSPRQMHSANLGGSLLENSGNPHLGYVGARIPSIGAIETVQSRIALTLGAHASENRRITEPTFSGDSSDSILPPIKRPAATVSSQWLVTDTVESFDVSFGETSCPVKLAQYSPNARKTLDDLNEVFHLTKKIPGNFVGAISSAVSSASPASNPFNPQRRGGGSNAYKIMLPGLYEHILVPVTVPGISSAGPSYHHHQTYRSRRGGSSGDSWGGSRGGSSRSSHHG